ncbi:hypothetical protein SNEBB_005576 [Seison nebaliae]|nr:hypothetical protein SNEBB_005576 [Seison nebaliae]
MLGYLLINGLGINESIRLSCDCCPCEIVSSSSSESENEINHIPKKTLIQSQPTTLLTTTTTTTTTTIDDINEASEVSKPEMVVERENVREREMQEKIGENLPAGKTMSNVRKSIRTYLNTPRRIFNPNNLKVSPICSNRESKTADFEGYKFSKIIGEGAQGQVVLLKKADQFIALKHFQRVIEFLAQINPLIALADNDYPMKLLDMMTGTEINKEYYEPNYNATSRMGDYCITMPFLNGVTLGVALAGNFFGDLGNYASKLFAFKFFISILRDLQLLHFSFNNYATFENSPIYGEYSHTLYHGDLMISNIMVLNKKRPILIDVGYHMSHIREMKNELIIQFYNKYLLENILSIEERKEHSVHRNQLLNLMQQLDFCMFIIVILDSFHINEYGDEHPMGICLDLLDWTESNQKPYRYQGILNLQSEFKEILLFLLPFNMPLLSYQQTWLKLYQFFYEA